MNPLKDWLDGLSWDGEPRLDTWLTSYLGVPETDYAKMVGSKWMISAIARAYKAGSKVDHVLILEGPQGKGKSTALATLAGETWFNDTPLDIGNKDAYMQLNGKWIIELAELASLNKAEADKAKAFFTSATDRYRPPYGQAMQNVPRRCVFAGTVNNSQYLRDETGNRRYWPVACGVIDIESLKADREQLWAEARDRYRKGEKWWPETQEQHAQAAAAQEDREPSDAWTEKVAEWLGAKVAEWEAIDKAEAAKVSLPSTANKVDRYVTTTDALLMVGVPLSDMDERRHVTRMGIVLGRKLKWKRDRRTLVKGTQTYVYVQPEGWPT